jgi:CDP-glycerol glycerophosphotransferase (TagB/SpsB family)
LIGTKKWMKALKAARVAMISSQLFDITNDASVIPANLKIVFLGHGKSLKATNLANKLEKSATSTGAMNEMSKRVSIAMATSPYVAKIASECYGIPEDKYRMTGHPRNDAMLAPPPAARQHWEELFNSANYKTTILYAPTWRQGELQTRLFPYQDFDARELAAYLERHDMLLLLRLHPRDLGPTKPVESDLKALCEASDRIRTCPVKAIENINPYLGFVDVLLTDYSSIWQDYILLDRPVIFLPYDYEEFAGQQGFIDDYFGQIPGRAVNSMAEFYAAMAAVSGGEDALRPRRQEVLRKFHTHSTVGATERVVAEFDALMAQHLGLPPAQSGSDALLN